MEGLLQLLCVVDREDGFVAASAVIHAHIHVADAREVGPATVHLRHWRRDAVPPGRGGGAKGNLLETKNFSGGNVYLR